MMVGVGLADGAAGVPIGGVLITGVFVTEGAVLVGNGFALSAGELLLFGVACGLALTAGVLPGSDVTLGLALEVLAGCIVVIGAPVGNSSVSDVFTVGVPDGLGVIFFVRTFKIALKRPVSLFFFIVRYARTL